MARYFDYEFTFVQPAPMNRDGSTALMSIDMQYHDAAAGRGLCLGLERINPGCCAYFNRKNEGVVVPTIARLLAYFRTHRLPVIHLTLGSRFRDLRDVPARTRAWIRDVERRCGMADLFWTGSPDFAIREELAPLPDETVVNKTTFGAFNSTNLEQVLRHMGVGTLVITGVSTNHCVETTARDAADRGFACVLVDEGTADYDAEAQDATLRAFHMNFGRVVKGADDIIAALDAERAV